MTRVLREHMSPNINYARAKASSEKRLSFFTTPALRRITSIAFHLGEIESGTKKAQIYRHAQLSSTEIIRILKLHKRGLSQHKIAVKVNRSQKTISHISMSCEI